MKNIFALTIPGVDGKPQVIAAPSDVPTGGLEGDGGRLIANSIAIFLIVCVIVSFVFVIYGGLNYIMSEGDKTKVQSARRTITFAIIGLIIALLSFSIINFIGGALGAEFLKASV